MPGAIDPNIGAAFVTSPPNSYREIPIPAGVTGLSDAVDLGPYRLGGIIIPATWVTATTITFQVSFDGTNYFNLYDDLGTEVSAAAAVSRAVRLSLADWLAVRWLKVRSGTSGTPVDQTNSPTLVLALVP